jgi:hypothetical protein
MSLDTDKTLEDNKTLGESDNNYKANLNQESYYSKYICSDLERASRQRHNLDPQYLDSMLHICDMLTNSIFVEQN